MESLQRLTLPHQALDGVKKLVGDLRMLCAKEVFKEATEGYICEVFTILFWVSLSPMP